MSAVDRMAVRTPDGSIRSVPRRVGLGMIAQNRAKVAPRQNVPPAGVKGRRPAAKAPAPSMAKVRERIAKAMDLPVEAITPVPGSNPHEVVAAQGQQMMDELEARGIGAVVVDSADFYLSTDDPEFDEEPVRELPPEPRSNASRAAWAVYAMSLGVEVTSDMKRNQIRDAAQDMAQTLDRLPQPAREGGRLATPEDEPVGKAVPDADPGDGTA